MFAIMIIYCYFSDLIGIMPYIDWCLVIVTLMSCASMLFESPWPPTGENLVFNNFYLQVTISILVSFISNGKLQSYFTILYLLCYRSPTICLFWP